VSASEKVDAWMPLWIGAYLADTMKLTTLQHGAYLLLLIAYWRERGPLADDDEELASTVKASPKEWRALRPKLERFFKIGDGVWRHGRADEELVKAMGHKTAAVAKAKAGAEARWARERAKAAGASSGTPPSNAPSIAQALPRQCPTPTPSLLSEESGADPGSSAPAPPTPPPPSPSRKKPKTPMPPDFTASDAVRAWAAKKGFDRVTEHLEAFKLKVKANDYRYVDWDAALENAIRDDWAKLRAPQRGSGGIAPDAVTVPSNEYAKTKAAQAADDALLAAQDPAVAAKVRANARAAALRLKAEIGASV